MQNKRTSSTEMEVELRMLKQCIRSIRKMPRRHQHFGVNMTNRNATQTNLDIVRKQNARRLPAPSARRFPSILERNHCVLLVAFCSPSMP